MYHTLIHSRYQRPQELTEEHNSFMEYYQLCIYTEDKIDMDLWLFTRHTESIGRLGCKMYESLQVIEPNV